MGATLRVDPDRLATAAKEQSDVGNFVSAMAPGRPMSVAATGMVTLASGAACDFAAGLLDEAAKLAATELATHSAALTTAADHYRRADAELGRRLRQFAQ